MRAARKSVDNQTPPVELAEEALSNRDLARRMGVTRRTVQRMRARGELPAGIGYRPSIVSVALVDELARQKRRSTMVPARVWRRLLLAIPHATPATLDADIRGALRAAATIGRVGVRRVGHDPT